ncbi:hypothetical protein [Devosia sp. A369]
MMMAPTMANAAMTRVFTVLVLLLVSTLPTFAQPAQLTMCGNRPSTADKTCVVDGWQPFGLMSPTLGTS